MNKSMKLFTIFGIDIKLHYSWWFVFMLLSWSLSTAYFPQFFPDHTVREYWFMGLISAVLLFVSVLLHELSHSVVAMWRKIKVESITLFFFGGVAGITKEDMKPSSEFMMAIAGPIFSLCLGGIFYIIYLFNGHPIWTAITHYLFRLNLILAVFNMVPAFPLDGGRALRAGLYAYFGDLKKATRIASKGGKFFATFLIFLGIFAIIGGEPAGLWFVFLGGFLWFIAGMSYEQVVLKNVLSAISVKELMNKKVIYLKPEMVFADFVKKYANVDKESYIVKDKKFVGILDLRKVEKMVPEMQQMLKLKQISLPLSQVKCLREKDNCYVAYKRFAQEGIVLLPVMRSGKVVGVLSNKLLMHRLIWGLKFGRIVGAKRIVRDVRGHVEGKQTGVVTKKQKKQKKLVTKKLVTKKRNVLFSKKIKRK